MTGSGFSRIQTSDQTKLTRGLKRRHIELITIGGAIGVGLFLGSAKVIQNAGPGLILGYAVGGLVIFFIMRALGELLLYRPGRRLVRDVCRRIRRSFRWFRYGLVLLVHLGRYRHGRAYRHWRLCRLLASRPSAMDNGIGRAGCAVRREYAGRARVRRDGVLVCADQSRDDRHAHCGRAGSHPFPRRRLRGDGGILESLVAWWFVTLRTYSVCCSHSRW